MGNDVTIAPESSLAPPVDLEIGLQVIERLAVGRSLDEIASVKGFPSRETFFIWLIQSPALAQAFTKAREISGYALEEEALTTLRALKNEAMTPAKAKSIDMLVQQLRWSAEKRNPQVYSKQNQVNLQIPVQINTSLDLGEARIGGGTSEFPNIYELKAEPVFTPPPQTEAGVVAKTRKQRVTKRDTPERLAEIREIRTAAVKRWRAKRKLKAEGADGSDSQD